MRIDYNILWFEDEKGSFDAKKESVKEIVEDFAFNFPEPRNEVNGNNLETINLSFYDLIIVDLRLEKENGAKLIEKIRAHEVFTEIIFYSSEGEKAVRDEVRKHDIDGVYCAGRSDDDFRDKVEKVIKTTIKKVQEINNVRGLVMAETSILDSKVENILSAYFLVDNEETIKIKESILGRIEDSLLGNFNKNDGYEKGKFLTLKLRGKLPREIVKSRIFDASKKARTIGELVELKKLGEDFPDFFINYEKDVIAIRNKLAHAKSELVENEECLIIDGDIPEQYDIEKCIEIRNCLRKYSKFLDKLHKIISGD